MKTKVLPGTGTLHGRIGPCLAAAVLGGLCLLVAVDHGDSALGSGDAIAYLRSTLHEDLATGHPFRARLSLATVPAACAEAEQALDGPVPPSLLADSCETHSPLRSARIFRAARAVEGVPGDPRTDHLLGLVELISGDGTGQNLEGVRLRLRHAANADPTSADILNDLAVVQAMEAERLGDPRFLIRALMTLDLALNQAPSAPAPAFNRALFLERLGLLGGARRAWGNYLEDHREPGFERQARIALDRLRLPAAVSPEDLHRLADHARQGRTEAALALLRHDPQRARELALGPVLGTWGEAHLAGDREAAHHLLGVARRLGVGLADGYGDGHGECTVERAVERIDQAAHDLPVLHRLAAAHVAYARGEALFRRLRSEQAEGHFQRARELVSDTHPLQPWARMGLAGSLFYRHDHARAAAEFAALLAATAGGCQQAVAGRSAWGLGLTRLRQGHYTAALANFRDARRRFIALHEAENLGAVTTLLGETVNLLGSSEEAWESWSQALRALAPYRGSLRRHNLLWELARSVPPDLGPRAALILADESVLTAQTSADPGLLPEALLWRARFHAAAGNLDRAAADLDAATAHNGARPAGPAPRQVAADIELARGVILVRHEPAAALAHLTAALDHYSRQGLVLPRPEALLARGRALRALGQPRRAHSDLAAALDLYRAQRAKIPDLHLRRSFTETMQAVFDETLDLLTTDLEAGPEVTLRLAEEARDLPFSWGTASGPLDSELPLAELAERAGGATVLVYTWTPSRLHVWSLRDGVVAASSRSLDRAGLQDRIGIFVRDVRRGAPLDELAKTATDLHRLLLPRPLADVPDGAPFYVVPDRLLSAIPFDLLRNPETGRLVAEAHPVSLAPSLRSLTASLDPSRRLPTAPRGATLVADPAWDRDAFPRLRRLPHARGEVARIANSYPEASVLQGLEATVGALLANLDARPVFHYAGHAVFNARRPALSYLPLAPGGEVGDEPALYAGDLRPVRLDRLRLVVLSACTGLGPTDSRTIAISGLARPFLDAGATAVLGALWPVADRDAARLFPDFHRRFLATGDAVQALHQTKLAQLTNPDPDLRRPVHWAGFQIVGQARFPEPPAADRTGDR